MAANQPANPDRLQERFRTLMDSHAHVFKEENEGQKAFIRQVPTFLGRESELSKYFQPRFVSIGPLHCDKDKLNQGQQLKLGLAKLFIEVNRLSKEELYNNILKEIGSFKKCYQQEMLEKFNGDDEDLAWMFFVDGCALIVLFAGYILQWGEDFNYMNIDIATDLIISDNQLPLGVLNLIWKSTDYGDVNFSIVSTYFALEIMEMMHFEGRAADLIAENHMLELFWMNFVKKEADITVPISPTVSSLEDRLVNAVTSQFRGVKDLQAAGIILEPNNSSTSLRDISFNRGMFFCKLKIPRFRVSEQGKFLLFNLIAFEMHPNFGKDRIVTSYISFLNSLIVTKEDVAELRNAGILFNYRLNDEEVLKTIEELTSSLTRYPDIFSRTKDELIEYLNHKKRIKIVKWLKEALEVYFRSPWTTIGFISASFLLILTVIQTIFSILAYQHR